MKSRLDPYKYRALLGALLFLMVVYPTFHHALYAQLLYDVLLTVIFLMSLWTLFQLGVRWIGFLLGVPVILGLWTGYYLPIGPQEPMQIAFHALAVVFLVYLVATILLEVYSRRWIDLDGVCGALCGYVLMGLMFAHLYCIVETINHGAFRTGEGLLPDLGIESQIHFQLTYFSFVTMTTVGYGDLVPATSTARSLAIFEAILGQFYIAVLVAELIGKKLAASPPAA